MSSQKPPKKPKGSLRDFLFGHDGLSAESVNQSLLRIGTRAFISVPSQYVLFWFSIFRVPEYRVDPFFQAMAGVLVLNTFVRFIMFKFGTRIMLQSKGQLYYRSLFFLSAFLSCSLWGGSTGYAFNTYGIEMNGWLLLCGNIGACASFVAAAGFETLTTLVYMAMSALLPAAMVWFHYYDSRAGVMAGELSLYWILLTVMALSSRKMQIALLHSFEKLAAQEAELRVTHDELAKSHGLIRTMLESIDQAFLLFNSDGYCVSAPSEKSKSILALDPSGKHISEIVPSKKVDRDNLTSWVKLLFLDKLPFKDLICLGPSRGQVASTGSTLNLKYHPLRDEQGKMQSLVFTTVDVTQEVKAEKAAAQERERSDMILRILAAKSGFQPFIKEFRAMLASLKTWQGGDTANLRRDLHTMKGAAMIFGAKSLGNAVHATELDMINERDGAKIKALVNHQGGELEKTFEAWLSTNMELFTQLGLFADQKIEISKTRIDELKDQYADPRERAMMEKVVAHLTSSEFGELLREFESHAVDTATKLGKKVRFKAEGAPIFVRAGDYRETLKVLVHLFNNAIDHGFEIPEIRAAAGKPAEGTLRVHYDRVQKDHKAWIQITISDDGGGINIAKLREKLAKTNADRALKATDLEIAMQIFESGVSTRDAVTEISGQGVGMGSVRATIQEAGGRVQIARTSNLGTVFEILIPEVGAAPLSKAA